MNEEKRNYWVFKTVNDADRSYQSHEGYDDILSSKYVYDSNVANSKRISSNDMIVLVDKKRVLGFAKISRIKSYKSTKQILRCPTCQNTNFEVRKTKLPKYRCNRGHEFHEPQKGMKDVIKYESYYGNSFKKPEKEIPISILKNHYNRGYNRNMSIQSIEKQFIVNIQDGLYDSLENSIHYISPDSSDETEPNYEPNENDEREKVIRIIKARRGQSKFRKKLLKQFGSKCCVTGCSIVHLLEAAHINPYKGEKDNHPSNGLLLRADIHTLFDLDMLGIHPDKRTVHLNEEVNKDKYEDLNGNIVIGDISESALKIRWELFLKNQ